ncbi:hypothetical protein BJ969_003143 [Saccharopolyspora gloriosae]|uniref:Uncharacterized protein n=1 Tax=Saccharopolyspora gloriosae TaxID=455344 RepID=A0A840NJ41_9PSEU|nr:hypothetical protein [Saccharopolyspora gloriosae]
MFRHGCCCEEWHKTMRIVVYVIASLVHGLVLVSTALPY